MNFFLNLPRGVVLIMSRTLKILLFAIVCVSCAVIPVRAQDAVLTSFTLSTGQLVGGSTQTATATITINRLCCPNDNVQVPITLSPSPPPSILWGVPSPGPIVSAGTTSVSFTFGANFLSQDTVVTLTASYGGNTITQSITATAPRVSLSVSPSTLVGHSNQTATGTVTLD